MSSGSPQMRPIEGEEPFQIDDPSAGAVVGLCRPAPSSRAVALVSHGAPGASFLARDRIVAEAIQAVGVTTIRPLFRPLEWNRFPTREEVEWRMDVARRTIAWIRSSFPGQPVVLVGGSIGAILSARLVAEVAPTALVLVSAPFFHEKYGESHARWGVALQTSPIPKLVVLGGLDSTWGPREIVEKAVRGWRPPTTLTVIEGAGHELEDRRGELIECVRSWLEAALPRSR